jgi:hypothetical protein
LAAPRVAEILATDGAGFVYDAPDLAEGAFVREAADELESNDLVAVRGTDSDPLAFLLFQLSGARLAAYDDPTLSGNELRIRFRDLAEQWEERMSSSGFEPDWLVVPLEDVDAVLSVHDARPAVDGLFDGRHWALIEVRG